MSSLFLVSSLYLVICVSCCSLCSPCFVILSVSPVSPLCLSGLSLSCLCGCLVCLSCHVYRSVVLVPVFLPSCFCNHLCFILFSLVSSCLFISNRHMKFTCLSPVSVCVISCFDCLSPACAVQILLPLSYQSDSV